MANLIFKGHATRGKELHKLLENLGGVDCGYSQCSCVTSFYYINREGYIEGSIFIPDYMSHRIIMSLETFESKYPYKVGDKVNSPCKGCIKTITSMEWNTHLNTVTYKLDNRIYTNIDQLKVVNDLQPYKEETMDKVSKSVFDANAQCCDISNKIIKKETIGKEISGAIVDRFICLEGYDFYDDKGNIINTKEITMKKKKPKYPKTYEECREIMGIESWNTLWGEDSTLYEEQTEDLINAFIRLKVCRDSYWKIAGDWKPDFVNEDDKFIIAYYYGKIYTTSATNYNRVLVFPTEEMRDAFYENFKELIESCKELL